MIGGQVYEARTSTIGGIKSEPQTKLQEIVIHYMISRQNFLIDKFNDDRVTTKVIFGNCESMLTAMTRQQQLHEIYDVWDVDLWRPGTQWESMKDVPSLANAILSVDPKVEAEISKFDDRVSDQWMKPLRDFESTPSFRAMSRDQQVQALREFSRRENAGASKVELGARAVNRITQVLEFARSKVTAAQRKEIDEIVSRFEKKMATAINVGPQS
jgi:hypothetical protein